MKDTIIERGNSFQLRIFLGKNLYSVKYDRYIETFLGSKPDAQKRLPELLPAKPKPSQRNWRIISSL